jgi:biopolymer transport protein ExbB
MKTLPFRTTCAAVILALVALSPLSPLLAQQKTAAPAQAQVTQAPLSSQPAAPAQAAPALASPQAPVAPAQLVPAPAPSAAAQPAPASATPDVALSSDGGRAARSTVTSLRELSPWSMFMSADIVVKAVMVGLAFA